MGSIARAVTSVAQPVSGGSTNFPTSGFGSGIGQAFQQLINQGALTAVDTKPGFTPQSRPSLVEDFYKSSFYDPKAMGTMALVPVTLPTGEKFDFSGGAPASQFQEYVKSLGYSTNKGDGAGYNVIAPTPTPTPTPPIVERPIPILERPTPVPSPTMPTPNLTTPIVETPTPNLTAPIVETPTSTIPTPFPSIPTPVPIMDDREYANLNPDKQIPYKDNPIYQNFLQSPFYNPMAAGSQVMTPVQLPTGEFFNFGNAATADQFRQYFASTPAGGSPVQGNLQNFSLSNIYKNSQKAPVGIENSQSFSLPNIYKNGGRVGFKIGGSVGLDYLIGE